MFQGSLLSFPITLFFETAQISFMDIKPKLGLKWQDDFHNQQFQNLHT
jgi:hypothetical protein